MSNRCMEFANNFCQLAISEIDGKLVEICIQCGTRDTIYDPKWDMTYKCNKIVTERLERFGLPVSLSRQVLLAADNNSSDSAIFEAMSRVLAEHQIYVPHSKLMYINKTNVRARFYWKMKKKKDTFKRCIPLQTYCEYVTSRLGLEFKDMKRITRLAEKLLCQRSGLNPIGLVAALSFILFKRMTVRELAEVTNLSSSCIKRTIAWTKRYADVLFKEEAEKLIRTS